MYTVWMRKLLIIPCLVTRTRIVADFDPYHQRHRNVLFYGLLSDLMYVYALKMEEDISFESCCQA